MTDVPIQVNATPTKDQIEVAIRQIVLALGPVMTLVGYAGWAGAANVILAVAGPVATVVVFVWGQLYTRSRSKKMTVMAEASPNSVAQVKS